MPGTAEHRMVGYPILDAELAKPPIGQIGRLAKLDRAAGYAW
jgi:hypothetical protein